MPFFVVANSKTREKWKPFLSEIGDDRCVRSLEWTSKQVSFIRIGIIGKL